MNDAALDQFWGLSEASLRWVGGLLLEMLPRTLVFGLVGFVAAFGLVVFAHRRGWFVRRHRVWNILCKLHVPLWIVLFSVFGCALGAARSVESRVAVELDESFGPLLAAQLPTLKTFLLEELPVRSADDPISVGEATQRFLHKLVAMGRKAWLFAGAESGAERLADLFSVVSSCDAAGVAPAEYIDSVLPHINDWPNQQLGALTPARWRTYRETDGADPPAMTSPAS